MNAAPTVSASLAVQPRRRPHGRRVLRVWASIRLCDDSSGRLLLRISQSRRGRGAGAVAGARTTAVVLAEPGCLAVPFRRRLTGRLAAPGRYVLALRVQDASGAASAFAVSRRTR